MSIDINNRAKQVVRKSDRTAQFYNRFYKDDAANAPAQSSGLDELRAKIAHLPYQHLD